MLLVGLEPLKEAYIHISLCYPTSTGYIDPFTSVNMTGMLADTIKNSLLAGRSGEGHSC